MLTTALLSSKNNEAVRTETWYIQSFTQVEHPLIYSGDKQYTNIQNIVETAF